MKNHTRLFEVITAINAISNNNGLDFDKKLRRILLEIVECMQANSGSIMLVKGRKSLEVVASTNGDLIGRTQPLDGESPSSWVVKNRAPLYVDNIHESEDFLKKYDHYHGMAFLLVPIIGHGKVIGVISVTDKRGEDIFSKEEQEVLLNITGQVISALENLRLTDSLKKKKTSLQRKNLQLRNLEKLKTDLFNMLIHDLKGPISELIANLDILSYTISDDNREYVESAKTGCDTLYRMVSNLLDIVRLEEDRLKLVYERIDPQELLKEALARLFGMGKIKGLSFVEAIPDDKNPDLFWGDRTILLRVLQNLLTNAINYSPAEESIEVGFQYLKSSGIQFFVKDKGPGIAQEYQNAIFDKYFQIDKKGDGRIYTTGLGLTFCKMAVEAHRGKIGVESEKMEGSRFFFVLPLERRGRI